MATIQGPGGSVTMAPASGLAGIKLGAWSGTLMYVKVPTTGFVDVGNVTDEIVNVELHAQAVGAAIANTALVPAGSLGATPDFSTMKGTVTLYGSAGSGSNYQFVSNLGLYSLGRPALNRYDISVSMDNTGPITQI